MIPSLRLLYDPSPHLLTRCFMFQGMLSIYHRPEWIAISISIVFLVSMWI